MKDKASGSVPRRQSTSSRTLYPEMGGADLKRQLLEVLKRNE